jgi:glutamate carboxypeptidase
MIVIDPTAADRIVEWVRANTDEMVDFLKRMVLLESPSDVPESQAAVQKVLSDALVDVGLEVSHLEGRRTGGHLLARPRGRIQGVESQLMIGHCDTVWPVGTLEELPVEIEAGKFRGPGVFDMKGGLTQIVFALKALAALDMEPTLSPVVFINSDEEIGSPESKEHVERLAREVHRVFVLEPPMGPAGRIKTARKGVGRFTLEITGRPAHAGLDPDAGASAIVELSYLIQKLHALNNRERGVSVNVGIIDGGVRPNVVAPRSSAVVDVRVPTMEDGRLIEAAIHGLETVIPGVSVKVEGGIGTPPLERTPRNLALWESAKAVGSTMGLSLEHDMAGGGSDGNTTSQFAATLDGLGPIGDGAHALHEHIQIDGLVERCGLLAGLLISPAARDQAR